MTFTASCRPASFSRPAAATTGVGVIIVHVWGWQIQVNTSSGVINTAVPSGSDPTAHNSGQGYGVSPDAQTNTFQGLQTCNTTAAIPGLSQSAAAAGLQTDNAGNAISQVTSTPRPASARPAVVWLLAAAGSESRRRTNETYVDWGRRSETI
jgi:hypothetical protein